MNHKLSIRHLSLIITSIFFGCGETVKEENKTTETTNSLAIHVGNENYLTINRKESVITWKGASLMGSNSHTGYIYISKGELLIEKGQLVSGMAEVDMNTMEDEKHQRANGLINHLKDADFFDVTRFPTSTIAITKVESTKSGDKKLTGNLTIKGITNPVTFPAKVEVKDGIVKASGRLVIDRTKWQVRYKSRKFYDILANQTISDSIEFDIKIVAKR